MQSASESALGDTHLPLPILRKLQSPNLAASQSHSSLSTHAQDIIYMLTSERNRLKYSVQRPLRVQDLPSQRSPKVGVVPVIRLQRRDFKGMMSRDSSLQPQFPGRTMRRRESLSLRELRLRVSKL